MLDPGDTVRHKVWGKGKILATRYKGHEVFVQFDNGAITWAKSAECVPEDGLPENGEIQIPPSDEEEEHIEVEWTDEDERKLLHLQALEAFKLGIVPPYVKRFIFGREAHIDFFENWFENDNDNHVLIFGKYGAGKTHFLNYLKEMAEERNFAVSFCSIDPTEAPLHKPKYVYNQIVRNLTYNNGKNFDDFIDEIRKNKKYIKIDRRNPFVRQIFYHHDDEELFKRWIRGDEIAKTYFGYQTLQNFSTSANIFCNLLSFYSYCAKEILGLNGLILLLDEAESIEMPAYPYQRRGQVNFFKGIRMTAERHPDLFTEKVKSYSPKTGYKTELIYNGHTPIPFIYNDQTALKIVLAFTPGLNIMNLCSDAKYKQFIELDELDNKDKKDAIEAIVEVYQTSYDLEITQDTLTFIQKKILDNYDLNIRGIVKYTIECLDVLRHYDRVVLENSFP